MRFRLFKSKYNLLKRASPAKPGKRFVSFVIDFLIVFIVSSIFFVCGNSVAVSLPEYQESYQKYIEEIDYYNDYIVETHLVEEGVDRSIDYTYTSKLVYKNACRAICLSYELFGNAQYSNFVLNDEVKQYGIGDAQNDTLALFYLDYVPKHNENNCLVDFGDKTPSQYLFSLYKDFFGEDDFLIFSNSTYDLPVLTTQSAYYLFYYLFIDSEDSTGETGAYYYQAYENAYSAMLENAEERVFLAEPYYSEHYIVWQKATYTQARIINITLLICVVLAALIMVMIPKFLFKDETTIGRKLTNLGVINVDGSKTKNWVYLVKSLITCVFYFAVVLLTYLIFYGYDMLLLPITFGVNFSFGSILLILVVIAAINGSACLFTHNKQTFLDMLFQTKVVNMNYLDEGDLDEPEEAKPL